MLVHFGVMCFGMSILLGHIDISILFYFIFICVFFIYVIINSDRFVPVQMRHVSVISGLLSQFFCPIHFMVFL